MGSRAQIGEEEGMLSKYLLGSLLDELLHEHGRPTDRRRKSLSKQIKQAKIGGDSSSGGSRQTSGSEQDQGRGRSRTKPSKARQAEPEGSGERWRGVEEWQVKD